MTAGSSETPVNTYMTTECYTIIQFKITQTVLVIPGRHHHHHHHHHHWLDSSVWALAFFRSFRQSSLSIAAISP
jgi:hypothetical protein